MMKTKLIMIMRRKMIWFTMTSETEERELRERNTYERDRIKEREMPPTIMFWHFV